MSAREHGDRLAAYEEPIFMRGFEGPSPRIHGDWFIKQGFYSPGHANARTSSNTQSLSSPPSELAGVGDGTVEARVGERIEGGRCSGTAYACWEVFPTEKPPAVPEALVRCRNSMSDPGKFTPPVVVGRAMTSSDH